MKKEYAIPEIEIKKFGVISILTVSENSYVTDDNDEDAGNLFG